MRRWFRDWWRGWSDEDYESMIKKMATAEFRKPGSIMPVSLAELRAYHAMHRSIQ